MHKEMAKLIDHTLLKPEATKEDIQKLCEEAKEYNFMSVCVNSYWVNLAKELLEGTKVLVCSVVGFPLGGTTTETKAREAEQAIHNGASEIDMVINVGALKSGMYEEVVEDIRSVVNAADGMVVKVILEVGLLTEEEIVRACKLCKDGGASFVKTSTGFGKGCATIETVKLMHETVGKDLRVKASGGVKDIDKARQMVLAGASRIGTSSGISIIEGKKGDGNY